MRAITKRGLVKALIILMLYISVHVQASAVVDSQPFENTKYSDIIMEAAKNHEIHPALITAVIHAESNFNPKAVSPMGARGLMQINHPTQIALKLRNPFDPRQNIYAGAKYLKDLIEKFGSVKLAIAAYNAGPGNVSKYKGMPPYKETKRYVKKVMDLYNYYKGIES